MTKWWRKNMWLNIAQGATLVPLVYIFGLGNQYWRSCALALTFTFIVGVTDNIFEDKS